RELYHWSKLKHQNVLELLGVALFQGQLSMVSPWMANGTLQEYIAKNRHVDRWGLSLQVAAGLTYIHQQGMVHGDLKAMNILVSDDGIAKIADFGSSVML
ncbi:kinase-like protein, partial [Ceratobasidium sp. AG-I]